jgi:multidrug resistance efflux pump
MIMGVLVVAWTAWFVTARVPVYAESESARFEAVDVRWIDAPVTGELRAVHVSVGKAVTAGAVLLEMDASTQLLRQTDESAQRASTVTRVGLLRSQVAAARVILQEMQKVASAAAEEAHARYSEAAESARLGEVEARRARALFADGLLSVAQRDAIIAEAARKESATVTEQAVMRRIDAEQRVSFAAREAELDRLRAELNATDSQIGSSNIRSRLLQSDAERRLIRSPVAGRVASDVAKRPGAFVREGERLISVVPTGAITIVGHFRPDVALGRIRPGQRGRLRLDAFPPVEYGWVEGEVQSIASEPKDGRIRVELVVTRQATRIPLEHGLTGILAIETETVSPLTLVLRTAGKRS